MDLAKIVQNDFKKERRKMTAQEAKKFKAELEQEAQSTEQEDLAIFGTKENDPKEATNVFDGKEYYKTNPPLDIPTFRN